MSIKWIIDEEQGRAFAFMPVAGVVMLRRTNVHHKPAMVVTADAIPSCVQLSPLFTHDYELAGKLAIDLIAIHLQNNIRAAEMYLKIFQDHVRRNAQ